MPLSPNASRGGKEIRVLIVGAGLMGAWNRAGRHILSELSTVASLQGLADIAITDGSPEADAEARDEALARELRDARQPEGVTE